jgi:hypothetical protein
VITELRDILERTSGPGWPRRRCLVVEEAAAARAYGTTCGVGVVEVGRRRVDLGCRI